MIASIALSVILVITGISWIFGYLLFISNKPYFIHSISDFSLIVISASLPPILIFIAAGVICGIFSIKRVSPPKEDETKKITEDKTTSSLDKNNFKALKYVSSIISSLNNILTQIMVDLDATPNEELNIVWSLVRNGDKDAVAREFLKRINSSKLRAKALEDLETKERIILFARQYEKALGLLEENDAIGVFEPLISKLSISRVYAIFSGMSLNTILHRADDTDDDISLSEDVIKKENKEPKIHIITKENTTLTLNKPKENTHEDV